jgi:uncharacterized protein
VLTFLCVAAALYALVCIAAYSAQSRLVFFPGPAPRTTPAAAHLVYEDLELETSDGERLHAWLIRPATPAKAAVLVCHGNAGSIADRLHLAAEFVRMELAVLLFDYRGYGGSSGAPSERGVYLDAEAAYGRLTTALGFAPERTIVYGESLGGAVAIELALREKIAALIVEDTFSSLADVGARHYPWLPVRWITRYRFASIEKVPEIAAPKLFMHSPEDEIVPFEQGRALFEAAREPKQFLETTGGHNGGGFGLRPEHLAQVRAFIAVALASSGRR